MKERASLTAESAMVLPLILLVLAGMLHALFVLSDRTSLQAWLYERQAGTAEEAPPGLLLGGSVTVRKEGTTEEAAETSGGLLPRAAAQAPERLGKSSGGWADLVRLLSLLRRKAAPAAGR